jgi:hypothetical protein
MINPTFKVVGTGADAGSLAHDLADGLVSWTGTGNQVRVRAYDLHGTKPVYAAAEEIRNPGVANPAACVREVALCLSFFSSHNVKRQRGRLYMPAHWIATASNLSVRPSSGVRVKANGLVTLLTGLGGVNVDWTIFSRINNASNPVTDWWVDDEWDVQRRRGLRATTRDTGTTSEAGLPNRVRLQAGSYDSDDDLAA